MLAFLTLFLSLPREVRHQIWYLFLDSSAFSMTEVYRLTSRKGRQSLAHIQAYSPRPDRQLAFQFSTDIGYRRGGLATRMTKLARAHREGRIHHVGTTLSINLHTLFTTDSYNLGLVKKVIMLALQLKTVTTIEFQVWDYISGRDYHYYRCIPFDLFLEHIAPCICKNPRGVTILYDSYYAPADEEERELVLDWYFRFRYYETDPYAARDPDYSGLRVCQDWVAEIGATNLRGWGDHWWDKVE